MPSALAMHGVVAHLRMRLGAEHVGVDEREVGHVEEVLDDARAAGVHDDRLVVVVAHAGLVPLREVVRAARREDGRGRRTPRRSARTRRTSRGGRSAAASGPGIAGWQHATPAAVVPPAVVAAHAACRRARCTERERGATVRALVTGGVRPSRRGCARARSACPATSARRVRRCRCRGVGDRQPAVWRGPGRPSRPSSRPRSPAFLPRSVAGLGVRPCRARRRSKSSSAAACASAATAATSTVTTRAVGDDATALHPHVADVVAAGGEDEVGGDVEVGVVQHGHEVQAAQVDRHDVGVLARLPATR